jgi:hypothetical protein
MGAGFERPGGPKLRKKSRLPQARETLIEINKDFIRDMDKKPYK